MADEEDDVDHVQDVLDTIKNKKQNSKKSSESEELNQDVQTKELPEIIEPDIPHRGYIKPKELSEFSRKLVVLQTLKPRNDVKHQNIDKFEITLADRIDAAKRDGISLSSTSSKSRSESSVSSGTPKKISENKQLANRVEKRSVGTQTVYNDVGVIILQSRSKTGYEDRMTSENSEKKQSHNWKSLVNDLKKKVNNENSQCRNFFKDLRSIRKSLNQSLEETNYIKTETKATNTDDISGELNSNSERKSIYKEKRNSEFSKHFSDEKKANPSDALQYGASNSTTRSREGRTPYEHGDDELVYLRNCDSLSSSRSEPVLYASGSDRMQYQSVSSFSDKTIRQKIHTKHKKIAKSKIDCWWPEGNKHHCAPNISPGLRTHENKKYLKSQFMSFRVCSGNIKGREMTTQEIYHQDLLQMLKRNTTSSQSSSSR